MRTKRVIKEAIERLEVQRNQLELENVIYAIAVLDGMIATLKWVLGEEVGVEIPV